MLSALLISYVKKIAQTADPPHSTHEMDHTDDVDSGDDADEDGYGEEEREDVALKILIDRNGVLRETNQVIDYLYRGETLRSMAFYDFCRCVRLEKMSVKQNE